MSKLIIGCPPSQYDSDQPIVMLVLCTLTSNGCPGVGGESEIKIVKIAHQNSIMYNYVQPTRRLKVLVS